MNIIMTHKVEVSRTYHNKQCIPETLNTYDRAIVQHINTMSIWFVCNTFGHPLLISVGVLNVKATSAQSSHDYPSRWAVKNHYRMSMFNTNIRKPKLE